MLIGVVAGWLWIALKKLRVNDLAALPVVGVAGALTNTGLVMTSIYLLLSPEFAAAKNIAMEAVLGGVMAIVAANGVPEAIAAAVLVTAIGKALLSGLSDQQIRTLYADGLPRLTERTVTDLDELLHQLRSVREGAIATEQEESTPQLACWAVPLRRRQHVFSALSVSVPLFRCQPEKVAQVCQCLLNAQSEIEQMAKSRDFTWSMN